MTRFSAAPAITVGRGARSPQSTAALTVGLMAFMIIIGLAGAFWFPFLVDSVNSLG